MFWLFLFSKKFIINRKTNNINSENKLFSVKKAKKINTIMIFFFKKLSIFFILFDILML